MSTTLLGGAGGVLAMLGVIACPITSGDTAFRSARLTIADWFKIDQQDSKKRLLLSAPLLLLGFFISKFDYTVIWRYFSWSNQTLAMMSLWAGATYICRYRNKAASWVATIPAVFMSAVCSSYILQAKEGLKLDANISNIIGLVFALVCLFLFVTRVYFKMGKNPLEDVALEVK